MINCTRHGGSSVRAGLRRLAVAAATRTTDQINESQSATLIHAVGCTPAYKPPAFRASSARDSNLATAINSQCAHGVNDVPVPLRVSARGAVDGNDDAMAVVDKVAGARSEFPMKKDNTTRRLHKRLRRRRQRRSAASLSHHQRDFTRPYGTRWTR